MKKIFTLFIGISLSALALAQGPEADERLLEHFSTEQIATMEQEMPGRIAYWNHYLDNSIVILPIALEKEAALSNLPLIEASSSGFHALSIPLDEYRQKGATFRFKGEQMMLYIKSMSQYIAEYNKYTESLQP